MAWKLPERVTARIYPEADERRNFVAGYSDGFFGFDMWTSSARDYYPNAYSAGYHEGAADAGLADA